MSEIQNEQLLTDVFGRFSSFHDAEVVRINLNRSGRDRFEPELEALVHVFQMTSEVDDQVIMSFRTTRSYASSSRGSSI